MIATVYLGLTLSLLSSTVDQTLAYNHSPITQRCRLPLKLHSAVESVSDNLAVAVLESSKDVKKLKFEPVFKSFAENEYFVSVCRFCFSLLFLAVIIWSSSSYCYYWRTKILTTSAVSQYLSDYALPIWPTGTLHQSNS